jgi:serine/threonine-protein kinase
MKHVREVPRMPSTIVPDIPPVLESIILAAMAKSVDARYQSAEDLRADLLSFQRGRPVMAAPAAVVPAGADQMALTAAASAARRSGSPQPPPPRRRWGAIIATTIGLGLLAAVVVYLLVSAGDSSNSPPLVDVPDVVNQQIGDATTTLQQKGFKVSQLQDETSSQKAGTVLSQDPAGGRRADKGSTIVLTVSSLTSTVPNVVGQTIDQATTALSRIGLTVTQLPTETADKPPGTVIATDPAAGATVQKGSAVKVAVAAVPGVAVPQVSGKSQGDAGNILSQAGLVPKFTSAPSNTVPSGNVIGTDPAAGAKVPPGSTVNVSVSTGPQQVTIPNTIGQTQLAAQGALTGAGFNVTVNQVANPANAGKVIAQSPSGGQAPPGTNVTITVGV